MANGNGWKIAAWLVLIVGALLTITSTLVLNVTTDRATIAATTAEEAKADADKAHERVDTLSLALQKHMNDAEYQQRLTNAQLILIAEKIGAPVVTDTTIQDST